MKRLGAGGVDEVVVGEEGMVRGAVPSEGKGRGMPRRPYMVHEFPSFQKQYYKYIYI